MNSRPLPWQGNALPLSYARILGWPRLLQIPLARASRKPWRGGRPAGRSGEIRTHDPCLPKTVLYQAELHSETSDAVYIAGPVLPQACFAAAAAIFPHELVRALCQPGDLPVLRAGTNVRPQLGRSQVVRQRLLVPPCAGSNPAAPASPCSVVRFPRCAESRRVSGGYRTRSKSGDDNLRLVRRNWRAAPSSSRRINSDTPRLYCARAWLEPAAMARW